MHAEQGVALVDATNSALESGLFYAPVATCTEEAADVASQMMELPSLEWFQLPLASTGRTYRSFTCFDSLL